MGILAQVAACDLVRIEERRGAFWDTFRFSGQEHEVSHFDSLAEMLAASDAVVIARVDDVVLSRIFDPQDGSGGVMPYLGVRLIVDRVIAGVAPRVVPLEFLAGRDADEAAAMADELRQRLPADSIVVFLHEKRGPGEAGLYRVTNSTGLWAPTARAALDSPLTPAPPAFGGLYAAELSELKDMDAMVQLLERPSAEGASPTQGA